LYGRIAIGDVLMEKFHTARVSGTLFAVNMLVRSKGGETFTFEELWDDLKSAGLAGQSRHGMTRRRTNNPA
jgi:hypothetical protein